MPNANEKFSFMDLITNVAGSSIVFGGFLYAGGWSYIYQYYRSFGLESSDLDIPVYDALIYSLPVIFNSFWSILIVSASIIGVSLIFTSKKIRSKLNTSISVGLLFILILLGGYFISHYGAALGNERARSDMQEATSNLPTVAFQLNDENGGADSDAAELNKLEFKLLTHTKEQYYIFRPFTEHSIPDANVELIIIPESRVRKIRVQRGVR